MGGSASKTAVSNLSSTITSIAESTVQTCVVDSSQNQNVVVNSGGLFSFGDYNVTQSTDISSQCFSDTSKQTQLQNQIIQAISQASTADGVALLSAFGSSSAAATANLTNIIQNNVTMSNIQNNYNTLKQSQASTFNNLSLININKIDVTQGAQVFAAATLQAVDSAGVLNTISNYVDQQSKATTDNPLDFLTSLLSGVSSYIIICILIFAAVILIAIVIHYTHSARDTA